MFIKNKIPPSVGQWHQKPLIPVRYHPQPIPKPRPMPMPIVTKPHYHPPPADEDPILIHHEVWQGKGVVIHPDVKTEKKGNIFIIAVIILLAMLGLMKK